MRAGPTWHPVVRSADLRAGENIVAAWADGRELAVWRSASGRAQVWDNRCPHRSARLTLGCIDGERLACAYHGWQWQAGGGECVLIPAHPSMDPPRVGVEVHTVQEQSGMVWVMFDPHPGLRPTEMPFDTHTGTCSTTGCMRHLPGFVGMPGIPSPVDSGHSSRSR
jgi:phenylpropionate dioxygenase-like ring-hydroxylating dioxygenase large terminal subunit